MTRFFNFKSVSILFLIIAFSIFIWLLNAKPVLVEWYYGINFGSICDPPFVILNPLRERQAENSANEFLEKLKSKKLEILDMVISDNEKLENVKNSEASSEIKSWFFSDRKVEGNIVKYTFWIERDYGGGGQSMPTGIDVENNGNTWKVIDYSPTY